MDIEKFTDRARGFLQAAQTIAIREFHQQVTPTHLLKALLDDPEGAASGLIRAGGGDPIRAKTAVENFMARLPKVTGGGASAQPSFTADIVRILGNAQEQANRAGDAFVAQDRVLVALAGSEGDAGRARLRAELAEQRAHHQRGQSEGGQRQQALGGDGRERLVAPSMRPQLHGGADVVRRNERDA